MQEHLTAGRFIVEVYFPFVDNLLAALDGRVATVAPQVEGDVTVEAGEQRVVQVAVVCNHLK